MRFEKYNANPKGWKTSDCVIRAIAKATGKTWNEVFTDLCEIANKKCRMPNDDKVWQKYLEDNGWVKNAQPKKKDGSKYTVEEFIENDIYCGDEYVLLRVAKHLTVIDGEWLIDTWNCGYKTVGNYWTKD